MSFFRLFSTANFFPVLLLALFLVGFASSCGSDATADKSSSAIVDEQRCFLKEYPFADGSDNKDVVALNLNIKGNKVSGTYDWLPAMKDQRKGSIEGLLVNNMVQGQYIFTQEGQTDTAAINIALVGTQAQIKGEDPEQDLTEILEKVPCQ